MEEVIAIPLIGLPVALMIVFGTLAELEDLSMQASDRAVEYADDAVNALDCAFEARPLTECSPGITNPDFTEEIEKTNKMLRDLRDADTQQH